MFGSIGPWELLIILTLALLIFGKRLPEVGRSLGRGIVEFRRGLKGLEDEIDEAGEEKEEPKKSLPKEKQEPVTTEESPSQTVNK